MIDILLFGKKKKISAHLLKKQAAQDFTSFDMLLSDYLSGHLKEKLSQLTMKRTEIHIDWLPDYKCICIQGKVDDFYFDIQIEPLSFSIAYDKDEPDDASEYPLECSKQFYKVIEETIQKVK